MRLVRTRSGKLEWQLQMRTTRSGERQAVFIEPYTLPRTGTRKRSWERHVYTLYSAKEAEKMFRETYSKVPSILAKDRNAPRAVDTLEQNARDIISHLSLRFSW
jgi:hypothetical protein